jgi:predicted TIM-barrel fold metal-dependent hydrolase
MGFEALIDIEGLRFSLAHASWPWCDECIALYGKFLAAKSGSGAPSAEMFIDITPGTPQIYRRELLTKLFTVGYDIENNIVFGVDCSFDDYAGQWAKQWSDLDRSIYADLGVDSAVMDKVFGGNLRRFVGISNETVIHRSLTPTG